jgi:dolichol-phosphate mannosyltransferase
MKCVVIVPTYNEIDNVSCLLPDLLGLPLDLSVIVIDDGSPDGTGQFVDDYSGRNPRVQAIHRPRKMGLGTAYIAGFTRALAVGYDRILTMDADYSHHPRYIPSLVDASNRYDMVIGSRYVKGGGTRNCGLWRRALSRGANALARTTLSLAATDCTAGFRCYRASVLGSISLDLIRSSGYSFLVEMAYLVQERGYTIGEVPILFDDRRHGTSKICKSEIARALQTVARLALVRVGGQTGRMRTDPRPGDAEAPDAHAPLEVPTHLDERDSHVRSSE